MNIIDAPKAVAKAPLATSLFYSNMCKTVTSEPGVLDKANMVWLYPVNALMNLAGLLLQPVISLVIAIVGIVFKGISLAASEENAEGYSYAAGKAFTASLKGLKAIPDLLVRIVYPAYNNPGLFDLPPRQTNGLEYPEFEIFE